MKKVLAIGASNSKKSINKKFAIYVSQQIENAAVVIADLNELELPLYSPDLQVEIGIPSNAVRFSELIENCDGIVLSLAEYNGMLTPAFKNIWDWTSRINMKIWKDKPMLLMAASPGGRGGANALRITKDLLPHFGGNVIADFSLPRFHQNFSSDGIQDPTLKEALHQKIKLFQSKL
ncbi:MAG: NAD(P)H-dependent oxidoreductase [Bacteroidota bacterium]